jgi:hypothetical protein
MAENILIFFGGNAAVPGAKPIWTEQYSPDKTIGSIIDRLIYNNSDIIPVDRAVVIFKFKNGDTTNYDRNDQFWSRDTKISEYLAYSGLEGNNVILIYYIL